MDYDLEINSLLEIMVEKFGVKEVFGIAPIESMRNMMEIETLYSFLSELKHSDDFKKRMIDTIKSNLV